MLKISSYILAVLTLVICFETIAQNTFQYRFRRMSPESGFFHNGIQAITQDGDGYIWFISINDLYKFDGYDFTRYPSIVFEEGELKDALFFDIYNDSRNRLWIATNQGLLLYDIVSARFRFIIQTEEIINKITEDRHSNIWVLMSKKVGIVNEGRKELVIINKGTESVDEFSSMFSNSQNIWFGTNQGEIFLYNSNHARLDLFTHLQIKTGVRAIEANSNGVYALTREDGLFRFSNNGEFINKYTFFLEDRKMKGNNVAKTLYCDIHNNLWIGTHRGIYILDINSNRYEHYTSNIIDNFSLPNNSVWTITEDNSGGVWIGTYSGGLGYMNFQDHHFIHIRQTTNISTNNNSISTFAEDKNGNFWIGTEGAGLDYYDRNTGEFTHYIHSFNKNSLSYDNVKSLVIDKNDNLWIGTYTGGLDFFDTKKQRFTNFRNDPEDKKSLIDNTIYSIKPEPDSGLWIATSKGGIDFFSFRTRQFEHVVPESDVQDPAASHFINGLCRGGDNRLWVASRHGLRLFDTKTKKYSSYYFNPKDTADFGSNEIFCVFEGNDSVAWIGTRGYGLLSFNLKNKKFRNYLSSGEIIATAIYSILDDEDGNLWISTNNGLFKYEIAKDRYHRFDYSDGLQGNLFYPNSSLKCTNGQMVFGGTNGFTLFHPDWIESNPHAPRTIITGLVANNKRIETVEKKTGEARHINYTDEIILNYKQSVFSFEFSAINYLMPEKNQFAYQLEGYDEDWNYTAADQRFASYSNLPPGNYIFHVKASNNDGIWNSEIKSINVEILSPPWKSWWAYVLYIFVLSAISAVGMRVYFVRKKFREQIQLERLSKEKMSELNRIKIQFFTNISHEFKTPLTLISSPLKKIIKSINMDSGLEPDIKLVQRNVIRLQNLINQLMDFRTIENKKLKINGKNGDVAGFLKELFLLFAPLTEERGVQMTFECKQGKIWANFDYDIFEKIFFNLLSNAVKFTPPGGYITATLEVQDTNRIDENGSAIAANGKVLFFQIANSGTKIPKEQIQHLFDNYYHIERHNNFDIQRGSGVGLAFTKELVELLGGEINVLSNEQETCFQIVIPMNIPAEDVDIKDSKPSFPHQFNYSQELVNLLENEKNKNEFKTEHKKQKSIIIVEDNMDLQLHLFDLFQPDYNVYVGSDGKEGLKLAKQKKPVLIISDVMMPKMNGTEMCRQLKSDIVTSHIPIIMLSAYNSREQKYEGMESGADVYVEKPFDPDYLKLQVKNLIQSREAIRLAFSKKITAEPGTVQVSSTDDVFIQKAIQIIEKNMDNNQFNVESFVSEIGIGRTVLYQKIKALTDLSVNEFIQNIRLKRAAQLLKDSDLSVSEIAYSIGFNDPKYFSTCFKKNFNQSPTEFISRERIT